MEHHSNLVPWQLVAGYTGARIRQVDIDDNGRLRLDQLQDLLSDRTKSRLCGDTSRTRSAPSTRSGEIVNAAKSVGALTVVDGAPGRHRTFRWTCRSSVATSTRSPLTRCVAPPASGHSGVGGNCWSP